MPPRTTRKMSNRHEDDLVVILGGEKTRGSGSTWSDQGDGHQTGEEGHYRFTWDGKSTCGRSIGVSLEMWEKITEQSRGLEPSIPLRFYADDRLTMVSADLIAVDLETFAQMQVDANRWRAAQGCLRGDHLDILPSGPGFPTCQNCGLAPYERGEGLD